MAATHTMNANDQVSLDRTGSVELFRPTSEAIRVDQVLRLQGYRKPEAVRRRVRQAADSAVDEANQIAQPIVAWRVVAVRGLHNSVLELNSSPPLSVQCAAFEQHLAQADHVVVYALTAGAAFDERVTDLHEPEQVLHGLLLESAAWMCIENTTRQFLTWMRKNARLQSRRITRRMAPGYQYRVGDGSCEWPLEQQQQLFGVFHGIDIPVRLLSSSAMLPKMSRSGLIGVRSTANTGH